LFSQDAIGIEEEKIVFGAHQEMKPEYKGGHVQLMNDLKLNLTYPSQACIEGKVYVRFVIDTLGQVTDVKIARGINKKLDEEAIRVVKLLNN